MHPPNVHISKKLKSLFTSPWFRPWYQVITQPCNYVAKPPHPLLTSLLPVLPIRANRPWKVLIYPAGEKAEEMQVPFIQLLITTLSQHSYALSWNVLIFSNDASCVFLLETRGKLERQMFPFAHPSRITCSFRRLLSPSYRSISSDCQPKGHCGRLRKRRGKSKRRQSLE